MAERSPTAATWRRMTVRRAVPRAVLLAGAAVFAAACSGSPNGPVVPGAAQSAIPASAGAPAGPLAYSKCMRAHGIKNFPDPSSSGGIAFNATGINPAMLQAAQQACARLRGPGDGNGGSPQNIANERKFANCMRAHGVKDFPDPNSNGSFSGSGGIDPQSAAFQRAQSICSGSQAHLSNSGSSS